MPKGYYDNYLKDKCGVFGIYNHKDAARLTYLGLYALQHRGEESAGIISTDGENFYHHKAMGLVGDIFNEDILNKLSASMAVGHVRYSTTGSSLLKNAQPLLVEYSRGTIAIAHNGNLVNAKILRDELEAYGSIFQTTVDSEIIIHLIANLTYSKFEEALVNALKRIKGAYSLVLMTEKELIGIRDPSGFRPLCLGKIGTSFVLASETCALDLVEAKFIREIEPGEIVFINSKGIRSIKPFKKEENKLAFCIFEHVYFARPDSYIFADSVHLVRHNLGINLAKEHPVKADLVMPVPDSGNSAALGFSYKSRLPLQAGLIRNHYIGRTFIQPHQATRDFNVRIKFNPVKEVLKNKKIVVVDDSIVRGTTCRARIKNLRQAGAKEIHMRISCPPIKYPCFYGIDFPTRNELIASNHSVKEIRKFLNADSLGYLSVKGLLSSVTGKKENYCTACFTGRYPLGVDKDLNKYIIEHKRGCSC